MMMYNFKSFEDKMDKAITTFLNLYKYFYSIIVFSIQQFQLPNHLFLKISCTLLLLRIKKKTPKRREKGESEFRMPQPHVLKPSFCINKHRHQLRMTSNNFCAHRRPTLNDVTTRREFKVN